MKYFVLLAGYGELHPWEQASQEEQAAQMQGLQAFGEACAAREGVEVTASEELADGTMATTMRTRGGQLAITPGPFAEAAQNMGGFYVINAPDLDTVIDLCKLLPAYDIEVRPVPEQS